MSTALKRAESFRADIHRRKKKHPPRAQSTDLEAERVHRYQASLKPTPAQKAIFYDGLSKYRYGIYPKGRRLGATRGGAEAFISYMLQGKACLWGDVIQANIRRYVDRYFKPALNAAKLEYHYNQQDLILTVGTGYTDFRSADKPEKWEGFGYDVTFLNEAGLILDNEYLWKNAVLPMMLDNPNSRLIAAGTPKLTLGKGLFFKELWERVTTGREGYGGQRFTTYDNPHLLPTDIDALLSEIQTEADQQQEVYGEFVDLSAIGSFFKKVWFEPLAVSPVCGSYVRAFDFAATPVSEVNKDPDWTVSALLGVHGAGMTVVDVTMLREGPTGVDAHVEELARADSDKPNVTYAIPVDPGSAGKVAADHYTKLIKAANPKITVVQYPQTSNLGSKAERAKPAVKAVKDGEVSYVIAPWNDWFFAQLAAFPNPKAHDDAVDAFSASINAINAPAEHKPTATETLAAFRAMSKRR